MRFLILIAASQKERQGRRSGLISIMSLRLCDKDSICLATLGKVRTHHSDTFWLF